MHALVNWTRRGLSGLPLRRLTTPEWSEQDGTWREARPSLIHAAAARAFARPSGNWYVFAGSREITSTAPCGRRIAGRELVGWRDTNGAAHIGPGACPHLGAPLREARVCGDELVCHWHGMRMRGRGDERWQALPTWDDGVLVWVRLDAVGGEEPTLAPVVPRRPDAARAIDAVATLHGTCEPRDIVANRLDPWHGAWFHPHSFANLRVLRAPERDVVDEDEDYFEVEVAFRLARRLGVPVLARFHCPEPRTVVMRIVEGEGEGSVVETHATPVGTDRVGAPITAVIEATVAGSGRPGFLLARRAAPLVRGAMCWASRRLWADDLAYAQRRYALRTGRV